MHAAMSESAKGCFAGGGSGIRTRDTVSRIHTFQACAFYHSATPPYASTGRSVPTGPEATYAPSGRSRLLAPYAAPVQVQRRPAGRANDVAYPVRECVCAAHGRRRASRFPVALRLRTFAPSSGPVANVRLDCSRAVEPSRGHARFSVPSCRCLRPGPCGSAGSRRHCTVPQRRCASCPGFRDSRRSPDGQRNLAPVRSWSFSWRVAAVRLCLRVGSHIRSVEREAETGLSADEKFRCNDRALVPIFWLDDIRR